jgi:hypothetical protein
MQNFTELTRVNHFKRMAIRLLSLVFLSIITLSHYEAKAEQIFAIPKPQFSASGRALSDQKATLVEMPSALERYISPRIVGGTTAGPNDFPEFVQLWIAGSAIGGDPGLILLVCMLD